jgi:hypothetical protein
MKQANFPIKIWNVPGELGHSLPETQCVEIRCTMYVKNQTIEL